MSCITNADERHNLIQSFYSKKSDKKRVCVSFRAGLAYHHSHFLENHYSQIVQEFVCRHCVCFIASTRSEDGLKC